MFTGLIQTKGTLASLAEGRIAIQIPNDAWDDPIQLGESIAVNGACLTVVAMDQDTLSFDLSAETLRLTTFASLNAGTPLNLERALRLGDRLGGHFVQGHVDGMGVVDSVQTQGEFTIIRLTAPEEAAKYLVQKGSIAVNGVSLTVVDPNEASFSVWLVPHTLQETNLGTLRPGDNVHLEYDALAKHVEKLLGSR